MKWKFKKNAKPQGSSDGFWYDLTKGGYINLSKLIADKEQLATAQNAVEVLKSLEEALAEAELLKEF